MKSLHDVLSLEDYKNIIKYTKNIENLKIKDDLTNNYRTKLVSHLKTLIYYYDTHALINIDTIFDDVKQIIRSLKQCSFTRKSIVGIENILINREIYI